MGANDDLECRALTGADSIAGPFPGYGLRLRRAGDRHVPAGQADADFVAVTSTEFMARRGVSLQALDVLRERHGLALHAASLSVGSAEGLGREHLRRLRGFVDRIDPLWVSAPLGWTTIHGFDAHEPLPLPYTEEALDAVCANVRFAQDVLEQPILLENPAVYVAFAQQDYSEWRFLADVCARTGCLLLLNLTNLYVSGSNLGFDPVAYLRRITPSRVRQIHLGGLTHRRGLLVGAPGRPTADPVWALYQTAIDHFGPVATMVEGDRPRSADDISDELALARRIAANRKAAA